MVNPMERFTPLARKVLDISLSVAVELKSSLIEPEHVLLALCRLEASTPQQILANNGIVEVKLLEWIRKDPKQPQEWLGKKLDLAEPIKLMLVLAVDEVRQRKQADIDASHFLIVLMKLNHPQINAILEHFKVKSNDIVEAIEKTFS